MLPEKKRIDTTDKSEAETDLLIEDLGKHVSRDELTHRDIQVGLDVFCRDWRSTSSQRPDKHTDALALHSQLVFLAAPSSVALPVPLDMSGKFSIGDSSSRLT